MYHTDLERLYRLLHRLPYGRYDFTNELSVVFEQDEDAIMIPSYASRLSENPNKGVVGLAEVYDSERVKKSKLNKLVQYFRDAKNIVCLTGAGISTSAGIADFRGPNGVWTQEKAESSKKRKRVGALTTNAAAAIANKHSDASIDKAKPTRTHEILTELNQRGLMKFIVSQNVDGLHLRSNFPRHDLVELHGNVFLERCAECKHEVLHDVDIGGVGCKPTGRPCVECRDGKMYDTVLDWDTPLLDEDMARAEGEMAQADLVLCLGTSLRIVPAAELPLLVGTARSDDCEPRICIVNLQKTPLDSNADLVIHCKVDEVMEFVAKQLLGLTPFDKPQVPVESSRPKRVRRSSS